MRKLVLIISIIFLILNIRSFAQDISPLPNSNIKKLIAPNNPVFYYNSVDKAFWVFKGETGWIRLAGYYDTKERIDSVAALYRIEEAPADHKVYGRKDSTWVEVSGSMLGNQTEIFNEIPTGLINGTNTEFVTDTIPVTNSERLFLNGIRQIKYTDYDMLSDNISFVVPPETYDLVTVDYLKSAPLIGTNYYNEIPSGLVNGSNVTFNTLYDIYDNSSMLYLNGIRQIYATDYTATSNIITFTIAPETNDILIIDYKNIAP